MRRHPTPARASVVSATTALAWLAGSAALAPPASAHVVLEQSEVAAGTTADLRFRAPIEKQGTTNKKIYALVPGPIEVRSCVGPSAAWRCTTDTTTRPGDTFVTWETPVAGSPQDLRFSFTVGVPADAAARQHKLPVVQTYADGSVARWIDDGEPSPAPRLTVLARGQAPSTTAPSAPTHGGSAPGGSGGTPAPAGQDGPPTTAGAGSSGGGSSEPGSPGTAAPGGRASIGSADTDPSSGPRSAPAASSDRGDGDPQDLVADRTRGDDGTSPMVWVGLGGLAVTTAAATAVVAARRRRVL